MGLIVNVLDNLCPFCMLTPNWVGWGRAAKEVLTGQHRCDQALEKEPRNQEYLLPGGYGEASWRGALSQTVKFG